MKKNFLEYEGIVNLNKPIEKNPEDIKHLIEDIFGSQISFLSSYEKFFFSGCLILLFEEGKFLNKLGRIFAQDFEILIRSDHSFIEIEEILRKKVKNKNEMGILNLDWKTIKNSNFRTFSLNSDCKSSNIKLFHLVLNISIRKLTKGLCPMTFLDNFLENRLYNKEIRRIRYGPLTENEQSICTHHLMDCYWRNETMKDKRIIQQIFLPFEILFYNLKRIIIKDSALMALSYGTTVRSSGIQTLQKGVSDKDWVTLITKNGQLVGMGVFEFCYKGSNFNELNIRVNLIKIFLKKQKSLIKWRYSYNSVKKKIFFSTGLVNGAKD